MEISQREAQDCLSQLQRAGLIQPHQGWFRKAVPRFITTSEIPDATAKKLHRQFIEKALEALDNDKGRMRYLRAKTLAVKPAYLPQIKEMIIAFCAELDKFELLSQGEAEKVCLVNIQLMDLFKDS